MALSPGKHLGSYQILQPLGSGGMGEVYRSRDTKLKREVAIKVLPDEFAADAERIRRFRQEAEVLATLNHQNIAQIYGLEETNDTFFLVLELVEGEDLAERLKRGPVAMGETLEIARQIAEALEAAHARGIVHRDLKPANIKISPSGQVKVLDFGLAKQTESEIRQTSASQSPTMVSGTIPGMILGTAAYMSPEQAKGRAADMRSDIWAFGAVLFQTLAGKAAFAGNEVVEILGSVLKSEPDWASLPQDTPSPIRSLLKRCLQKDRNQRLRDIADARFQIEEAQSELASPAAVPARAARDRALIVVTLALVISLVITAAALLRRAPVSELSEMRLEISTPPGASLARFEISPDGRNLVFPATIEGKNQLWLRPLDSETLRPLAGTEGATNPFWSPDSRSIGFFSSGQLKRIDIEGQLVQTLASAPLNNGGAWSREGFIVFARSSVEPLYRIPAQGGTRETVTRVEPPHQGHRHPHFLPDGRHFLFYAFGPPESQGVYIGSLDSMQSQRILDADSSPVFAPPDFMLFVRQGALLAQRLDLKTLQLIGEPIPVARHVAINPGALAEVAVSASAAGPVAYRADAGERSFIWFERSGRQLGVLGRPDSAQPGFHRLSRDGGRVAFQRAVDGNNDIWLLETARNALQRFTFTLAWEFDPVWSPDGSRILFSSAEKGVVDLFEKPLSGGNETLVWESSESKNAYDWSMDGRFILFGTQTANAARDLWVLPIFGEKKPIPVAQTPFEEREARFSPDGQWIAYQSNESGRNEVYIVPFPGFAGKVQVSTGGGILPQWRGDGRELFYAAAGRLMAIPVNTSRGKVELGTADELFSFPPGSQYEAAPDGQRFLINTLTKEPSPITILLNWKPRR